MDADRHEEIARCLFRESNDALFLFDPQNHRVLDVNPLALRLTGFDRSLVCTKTVWDLFSSESTIGLDQIIDAYRNTGFYHSRDGFTLARRKGDPIPVNLSVSRIHTSPSPMGLVVARDVTERKRAEAEIYDSEARYRGLIETAKVIFWSVDQNRVITALNPQFTTITGWEISDWVGRPLVDLVVAEDRDSLVGFIEIGSTSATVDISVIGVDGKKVILEFLPTSRLDEGVSGIARDVTVLRQAAESLRQAESLQASRKAAEMADRAKSEFLAHVSHEIRTPMTAILGFVDILLHDQAVQALPLDRLEHLRTIEQNGAHLLSLIDDILDISQIEAGKLRVEPSQCSPLRLIAEVVASSQVRAATKGLSLGLTIKGAMPEQILTDSLRFRQILINLIGNAVKFTESGSVGVSVEILEKESETPTLVVMVEDTGPGMTPEEVAELFKPFSRPLKGGKRQTAGNGLGLVISQRIAQMLGGTISVASTKGQGSRFRVELPTGPLRETEWLRSLPRPMDEPPRNSRHPVRETPAKILLAEDHPSIQRVTAIHLEQLGISVVTAKNGQEAVDKTFEAAARGEPFDVVLMDMQMPVLDGYEATRQLRARGFQGSIIALTAYAMTEDREECLRLGCDEHISKPVDWNRLSEVLKTLLPEPFTAA